MTSLTELGLGKARFTVLLMVSLVISGMLLYVDFPKREDPEIIIRTAIVDARYPGMTPERVENLIAEKIERKIREIKEVDEINTVLKTGSMRTYVNLKDEVTDLDPIWQELRDKMGDVERELPEGTQGPFVNTDFGEVAIATIAMTAEGFTYREMEVTAKDLQRRLYTVEGVSKVEISGVQEERIWLELDTRRFGTIGAQVNTLVNDLQTQNIILPAGRLNADGSSILLEASGDFKSVSEIENMLTQVSESGDFVRLNDIVTVRRGIVSPLEQPAFYNGRPALVLSVQMQPSFDVQDVGLDVMTMVRSFEEAQPIGYEFEFATFQPNDVSRAINDALSNVAQTFIVVLLVVLAFLGVRSGMVIASIVPFAVMFTLLGMNVLDIALEQVSIAAVIISLGLLVDNGVVIVEDILRRIDEGSTRHDAAKAAGKQFAMPLLISSLTTIFAFTPFFLMVGAEGEYAFSLGSVVALTLIGSWISAMYFLPLIASNFLRRRTSEEPKPEPEEDNALTRAYGHILPVAVKRAGLVIIASYALIFGTVQLFSSVPNEMFPTSDRGEVLIYMDLPKGAHISGTEYIAKQVSGWIGDDTINPEVRDHILYVGSGGPRFYLSLNPEDPDPATAFFLVNTHSSDEADRFAARAKRHLFESQPEGRFTIKRLAMGASESGTVDVEISGSNLERLLSLGGEVEDLFATAPGIQENKHNWGEKLVKFVIDIDQDKARRLNMSSQDMAQTLSAYFDGFEISEFRDADQTIPIMMRSIERDRNSIGDLLDIILPGGNENNLTPLEQLAVLKPQLENSQIRRNDQVRTITITGRSTSITADALYAHIKPGLDALEMPSDFSITIGGEIEDSKEIYTKLGNGLPYAFLLMILAVVFQFNSLRRGLVIFMTVPLALVGVPIGLWITGEPMSFFAMLGIISLAGIIINNAIVLVDQIDIELKSNPISEAIRLAGTKRLRPILLTSITTVVGLAPLYFFGGALWSPLAAVMMFGLAFASALTLVFVPAAYMLFFRRSHAAAS